MAAKKVPTLDPEAELEEEFDEEFEETTDQVNAFAGSLTVAVPVEEKKKEGPTTTVFLPKLLDDDNGVKVDQYEHVTIANERGEVCYKVLRGEPVEVPISVFMILKAKYPKL